MMYSNHKCPYCQIKLKQSSVPTKKIGAPIKLCYNCHNNYIDIYVREWAILKGYQKFFFIVDSGLMSISILCSFIIAALCNVITSFFIIFPLLLFVLSFIKYTNNKNDIKKSYERVKNPVYLELLAQCGYDIPMKLYSGICKNNKKDLE